MSEHIRLFVRLYGPGPDPNNTREMPSITFLAKPLRWDCVVNELLRVVNGDMPDIVYTKEEISRCRLFLLPNGPSGLAAELNRRSIEHGVRDNDQIAVCRNGESYNSINKPPLPLPPSPPPPVPTVHLSDGQGLLSPMNHDSRMQPEVDRSVLEAVLLQRMGSFQQGPNLYASQVLRNQTENARVTADSKKKRYRSISGKMGAMKKLFSVGIISNDEKGLLKDLLVQGDNAALEDALDIYAITGNTEQLQILLSQERQKLFRKRGEVTDDDLTLDILVQGIEMDTLGLAEGSSTEMIGPNSSPSNINSMFMHQQAHAQRVNSLTPTNGPRIGIPVSTLLAEDLAPSWSSPLGSKHVTFNPMLESSPVHHSLQNSISTSVGITGPHATMNAGMLSGAGADLARGIHSGGSFMPGQPIMGNAHGLPATGLALHDYGSQVSHFNPAVQMLLAQNPAYAHMLAGQPHQFLGDYRSYPGMGYPRGQLAHHRGLLNSATGKQRSKLDLPNFPPPVSRVERRKKIDRWLEKRERRDFSNKASYPVRRNIASQRRRGEDGRFVKVGEAQEKADSSVEQTSSPEQYDHSVDEDNSSTSGDALFTLGELPEGSF